MHLVQSDSLEDILMGLQLAPSFYLIQAVVHLTELAQEDGTQQLLNT